MQMKFSLFAAKIMQVYMVDFAVYKKTLSDLIFQKKSFYGRSMNSPIVGGSEYEYRIVKNRVHLGPVIVLFSISDIRGHFSTTLKRRGR